MKIKITVILSLGFIVSMGQPTLHDKMYLPNDGASTVSVIPGAPADWYINLQKYWYYRYRLVNDFLFIDPSDGPGSSIPAQKRQQGATGTWGDVRQNNLIFSDATIDLGHYIQMLATECQNLDDFSYSDTRTRYELQHVLNAFDRLDDNAEQYEYQVSNDIGANHGYPGTLSGTPFGTQMN